MAALDKIAAAGLRTTLSVKLTQLGLDIEPGVCVENLHMILERAQQYGNFIHVDMEDFRHCQTTLDIVGDAAGEYRNVGAVLQAYLHRSEQDAVELAKRQIPLRIVKGAYKEPREVAFPDKGDVDAQFIRLVEISLRAGNYTAIATHDENLINWARAFAYRNEVDRDRYEFQMLYGIRDGLQRSLAREGYRMRVYVPYGTDWYAYFMRRLAERPANVGFVLRSLYH